MNPPFHFSSRFSTALEDNALARAVAARRASGQPIYDLTLSNPTQAGFDYPHAEIGCALAEGARSPYEPNPRGLARAREAIAAYYLAQHVDYPERQAVDTARLHLTTSTSEAYGFLFKLLGDPGAEILAPVPSYPLIEHLAALDGWSVRPYPLRYVEGRDGSPNRPRTPRRGVPTIESGWHLDQAALAAAVTPTTRAIAVIRPHNPTGWLMEGSKDAHFLLDLCAERGLALIVDEVFMDYPVPSRKEFARSFAVHEVSALTFTLGGLSKSCGMPHLKLGWIHAGGPAQLVAQAQTRLDFIADAYLSVATPVQAAAPRLLEIGAGIRAQIQKRIEENYAVLASINWPEGFTVPPLEAGWCALLRRPAANDEEALARQLLDRSGVLAHPGYYFDFAEPCWHIVSLLPEPATFRAAVAALREWLPKFV